MIIGIDATNILAGGGLTHLRELLNAWNAPASGVERVLVWSGGTTIHRLPIRPWLDWRPVSGVDGSLLGRVRSEIALAGAARRAGCDVLFVPGSMYLGTFRPFVALSQNLLPFAPLERARYGISKARLRLHVLACTHALTFRRASGLIFLTHGARNAIERRLRCHFPRSRVIPHGVSVSFRRAPPRVRRLSECADTAPFRWLYVSIVDLYKHQAEVAASVCRLRRAGLPVVLDLIGPAHAPAMRRLRRTLRQLDAEGRTVRYLGAVAHEDLPAYYHGADGFVFASTCENMPNILVEAMASALPIVSSDRDPMPEVLGGSGVCVDVEKGNLLTMAMRRLMDDHALRQELGERASGRSHGYTWSACAESTGEYLKEIAALGASGGSMKN